MVGAVRLRVYGVEPALRRLRYAKKVLDRPLGREFMDRIVQVLRKNIHDGSQYMYPEKHEQGLAGQRIRVTSTKRTLTLQLMVPYANQLEEGRPARTGYLQVFEGYYPNQRTLVSALRGARKGLNQTPASIVKTFKTFKKGAELGPSDFARLIAGVSRRKQAALMSRDSAGRTKAFMVYTMKTRAVRGARVFSKTADWAEKKAPEEFEGRMNAALAGRIVRR
jgi:hypothetical protein